MIVILSPPGSEFTSKLEGIAQHLNAKVFNIQDNLKELNVSNTNLGMLPDSSLFPIVDKMIPELKKVDSHRILFGYPKTLAQIHHLRKHKVYPHKIFLINCDSSKIKQRLFQKLFNHNKSESQHEDARVNEIIEEYKG